MGRKRRRRQQQQRACSTFLEDLPNELLIEIFSYLNGVDVIYAFSSLNNRLTCLLIENCVLFNFQSISKFKFDLVHQYQTTKRWKALKISDDEHTLHFVEYFSQIYSFINDFPNLLSLAIINLNLGKTYTMLSQVSSIKNLISLTLKSDLPQLEYVEYTLERCHWLENHSFVWSSTLKYLKIIHDYEEFNDFIRHSLVNSLSLITLQIYQTYPTNRFPNGQLWENMIRLSLPSLKNFKFYFPFYHSLQQSSDQIKQIIKSFSTPFYTLEKQWFIRCDISDRGRAFLYSLPFAFITYTALQGTNIRTISTLLDDNDDNNYTDIFANVQKLEVLYKSSEPDENFHRNQVNTLILYNDFNSIKWMPVLSKLEYLEMNIPLTMSFQNFHHILKNAPHLHSIVTEKRLLQIATEHWNNKSICNYLSHQILSLKLCTRYGRSTCISKHEIQQIIRIFSSKCQHLSLCIQNPNDTIGLILNHMSQLQSLHINISEKIQTLIDMTWLQNEQTIFNSSNCMIFTNENNYYFWLGKRFTTTTTRRYMQNSLSP